jgi:D-arabinitol dehydrogenase (NADP+)
MAATTVTVQGADAKFVIPTEMKAIRYNKIKDFSLVTMPVPEPKGHEVLIKGTTFRLLRYKYIPNSFTVKSCGICGTGISPHGPHHY